MGDGATIKIQADASQVPGTLDSVGRSIQSFGAMVKTALGPLALIFTAKQMLDWGVGAVSAAADAEEEIALLEKTISNLGDKASMTSAEVQGFASEIQSLTKFEDDAAIAAQTLFLRLGKLDSDGIKRATVAAADLATVMKTDLESASKTIAKAIDTPEKAIEQLRAAGIAFTQEEEKMVKALAEAGDAASAQEIIFSKIEKSIGGSAAVAGESSKGGWAMFTNKLGDISESIGGAFLPMVDAAVEGLSYLADLVGSYVVPAIQSFAKGVMWLGGVIGDGILAYWKWVGSIVDGLMPAFNAWTEYAKALWGVLSEGISYVGGLFNEYLGPTITSIGETIDWLATTISDALGAAFDWLVDTAVWTFTAMQTAVENWREVAEYSAKAFVLAMVQAYEGVKHFFGEALPQYLDWFGRNWKNIFYDAGQIVVTIFKNTWENVKNFWDAIVGLFSGDGFQFDMTPLLDGFQSVTEELPRIAERVKGEYERALEGELSDLGDKIGTSFQKNLERNRQRNGSSPARPDASAPPSIITNPADNSAALAAAQARGQAALAAKEAGKETDGDKSTKSDKAKAESKADKGAGAQFEDLIALSKRIGAAAAGTKDDPATKATKEAGDKQAAATRQMEAGLTAVQKTGNALLSEVADGIKTLIRVIPGVGALE